MPDIEQNKPISQKYRYSIPQLLALASTAFIRFDLAKFSYDAARAGVVPSLGDCAMTSRKSSASLLRGGNPETASSADVLLYQGNRVVRPDRQPNLPPPVERQKDEGFATFLKKHSSPTHNRVTAGGRIVPMEPRSPPPFSLSGNMTNRPQAVSGGQQFQDPKNNGNNDWIPAGQHGQDSSQPYLHHMPAGHRFLDVEAGYTAALDGSQNQDIGVDGFVHNQYDTRMATNSVSQPMPLGRSYVPAQQMGGPVMQQPVLAQHYGMAPYQATAMVNPMVGGPVGDQYNSAAAWGNFNQPYQQYAQQVMSAQELLAAYQQHYDQLDQQLKSIDRHRAMNSLDHGLAEQRRTIVQLRSDAKDLVRQYQSMLGLKRMIDSSEESFTTGFNVEAAPYVPASKVATTSHIPHKPSFDTMPVMPPIERPRGSVQRRAIPIVPPPERVNHNGTAEQNNADDSILHDSIEVDEWGVSKRPAPPEVRREQSELSDMIGSVRRHQISSQHESPEYMSDSQHSGESSEDVADDVAMPLVIPPSDSPPRDQLDEYLQIIKAMGQPKGTITQLRQIHGGVMDVEGQGLDLSAVPLPSSLQAQNSWSKVDSMRSRAPRDDQTSMMPVGPIPTEMFGGKENFSVTPMGHQKAATDAFLAQFNAVDDNMALTARHETQSLRTTSNSRVLQDGRKVAENQGPDSMRMDSTEYLAKQMAVTAIGSGTPQPIVARRETDHDLIDSAASFSPDNLNNKGYSCVSVQNIHAVGSLPNNFDGIVESRQSVQAQLAAAGNKTKSPKSPRFLRRHGGNGGA